MWRLVYENLGLSETTVGMPESGRFSPFLARPEDAEYMVFPVQKHFSIHPMQLHYILFAIALGLSGCVAQTAKESTGFAQLPGNEYFLKLYRQDKGNNTIQSLDEYLNWVRCFYEGTDLYPYGWRSITQTVLQKIDSPDMKNVVRGRMAQLGMLISGEWAKNNQTRLINSRQVSIWGNALIKSLEQGKILDLIEQVNADMENLLARKISADVITEDRFYAEEDFFDAVN